MFDTALAIFTGIVIAAVSSWITVQLSLKRFRSERWWERKAQAYEKIIGALHDSKAFADKHLEAEYRGGKIAEEKDKELRARSKVAHEEIEKAIDTGSFLLSDEALSRLKQYQKDMEKASDTQMWFEYLEGDLAATSNCLKDLIQISKKDLRAK
ncbi:MAG: hypothetical protein JW976_08535 [Syntrophaceae bacterium]|nr:hypothetical protein [Syntrophaceae bacterium]